MKVLVTGTAGFIGYFTAMALLREGHEVLGIDNLNDYYDVTLKKTRLEMLKSHNNFSFVLCDIADRENIHKLFRENHNITEIIHLAAQPGVRYSLTNPYVYARTNIDGHLILLEECRNLLGLKHFIFASSSSVYGESSELPFSTKHSSDNPVSLYAATKKSMEVISHSYAQLYKIPLTGLRFFTVYGPWGRPDMAYYLFTKKILAEEPIPVFNNGEMRRDFTYIDDIVTGLLSCLIKPPSDFASVPFRIYNIGNNKSESLMDFISEIEKALGKKADLCFQPMQAGDVRETFADIDEMKRDFGFEPIIRIEEGVPIFVKWFKTFYNITG